MAEKIREFFKTFLLLELLKGMAVTGRHLFSRKITVQYPEEHTPQSARCSDSIVIASAGHTASHSLQAMQRSSPFG